MQDDRYDISLPCTHPITRRRIKRMELFMTLEEALAWAAPLARRLQGQCTVSVRREDQWVAVYVDGKIKQPQAFIDGLTIDSDAGFGLVESIISMGLSMVIVGMLATFMLTIGRSAVNISVAQEERVKADSRLERTLQHLDSPEDGVTVTWDDSAAPCRIATITTINAYTHQPVVKYATRGCQNQN